MELSTSQVGRLIGLTDQGVRKNVKAGRLPAVRRGVRREIMITLDDALAFATRYNYPINQTQLATYQTQGK